MAIKLIKSSIQKIANLKQSRDFDSLKQNNEGHHGKIIPFLLLFNQKRIFIDHLMNFYVPNGHSN